jgi:thiosulfate/3-mercaptopyruvate sulfurtransferase
MPWLINAAQLDKFRKNQKNVVILDATAKSSASETFLERHIVGARLFDLAALNDSHSHLPNLLTRDENLISKVVGSYGITNDHKIIFYDNSELHTSCRALWMFKVFGHNPQQLYILDGGLDAWEKYGGKVESGEPRPASPKNYTVNFEAHHVRTLVQIKTNLHHPHEQLIDVRHPVRFAGGPEPRPDLRKGHIPNSFSFPYYTMFEADGRFKPIEKIRRQLVSIGIDFNEPIVTTCGSGTTAPILNFVLDLIGHTNHSVYNGSWTEWGAEVLFPGEESLNERPVITSLD